MPGNPAIYTYIFNIPPEAIDANGHVNNVTYVQWMQDAAVRHYSQMGGNKPLEGLNATWVIREHRVEYLLPAFEGEQVEVRTWVADLRRVRSTRHYEFVRKTDGKLLVRGQTEWVFVETSSGRPVAIPEEIQSLFTLRPDGK